MFLSADGDFSKPFGKRGNGLTFLYLKEKLQKKQANLQFDCLRAINCVAKAFTVPGHAVPQISASFIRRFKRLEIIGSRKSGFDLMARVRMGAA